MSITSGDAGAAWAWGPVPEGPPGVPAVEAHVGWGWHVGLCLRCLDASCLLLLALDTEDTCLPSVAGH